MKIYESHLNFLGKIPIIQQFSGTGRVIYGVCKVIKHFECRDNLSLQEYERGKFYIERGLVEIIPVISTFALVLFDFLNQYQIEVYVNKPDKDFKLQIEVWRPYPSIRHLFNIFEEGGLFRIVNQEKNPQYLYCIREFGFWPTKERSSYNSSS